MHPTGIIKGYLSARSLAFEVCSKNSNFHWCAHTEYLLVKVRILCKQIYNLFLDAPECWK